MKAITIDTIEAGSLKKRISPVARRRIEAQGFLGYSDSYLAEINYWLRLAPAICMTWIAVGTYLASPFTLWALMPFSFLGAVLPGHPFDALYNHGIRHLTGTPALPPYGKPRRAGCALMTVWLGIAGWAFSSGFVAGGYTLGVIAVLLTSVNVTTGFCVPSFTYGLLFGRLQTRKIE